MQILKLAELVKLFSSNRKTSKGQFFSLDVIAGSLIFMIAFFLLAFYWLNAQAGMSEKTDDLQREAGRIADQLMVPGNVLPVPSGWAAAYNPNQPRPYIDDYGTVPYIHLVGEEANKQSEIACLLVRDLQKMSSVENYKYYSQVKEKLGIPRFEFYITIENNEGWPLSGCPNLAYLNAGKQPPSNAREVANAERIVLIDPEGSGVDELAKLRVQVWRP